MTLSEERLAVSTQRVPVTRAVLRKVIVVERRTITVDVAHEEIRLEQIPIDEAEVGADEQAGPRGAHLAFPEIVLHREELIVTKRLVPVERVRAEIVSVTEERRITEDVRREQLDVQRASTDG